MPVHFADIQFGFASAEVELTERPDLLLNAFLDPSTVVGEALEGPRFLVLGSKGSGKSAVGLHLSLLARGRHDLFVSPMALADLSYATLAGLVKGDVEPELRFPRAWSAILLVAIFASIAQDAGAEHDSVDDFQKTLNSLRAGGLIPSDNLGQLVGRAAVRDLSVEAWGIELRAKASQKAADVLVSTLTQHLKDLLSAVTTKSRHVLVIDGLDDVLLQEGVQLQAIAALILEASRLNSFFRERRLGLKILILCRTDIFERLPGPNQNKLRQDLALELTWYNEAFDGRQSKLATLANLRARVTDRSIRDVFDAYFAGFQFRKGSALKFLIEHTRHTPRDFLQLLRNIQTVQGRHPLRFEHVVAGARAYAERYFIPEVRDELEGVVSRADVDRFLELLRQLHRRELTTAQLRHAASQSGHAKDLDLDRLLPALYNTSAIGNAHQLQSGAQLVTFRYRNPGSVFNWDDRILVHPAVRRALRLGD